MWIFKIRLVTQPFSDKRTKGAANIVIFQNPSQSAGHLLEVLTKVFDILT